MNGCGKSTEAIPDSRIYLKEQNRELAEEMVKDCWKTVPEGRYLRLSPLYAKVIDKDSAYILETVEWEKNGYGYEWSCQSGAFKDTIWLISLSERYDTLHYTSPGYPPLNSWNAVRISEEEFEKKRQEVLFDRHLRNAACSPENVGRGELLMHDIAGRWKLIKDTETAIDYSCHEIIYDFRPDKTLVITGNLPDYPASPAHNYSFQACECWYEPFHPKSSELTIDGEPVRSEVLDKIMFLGDEANPSAKVFIRIE
jgi:hypothetical protein